MAERLTLRYRPQHWYIQTSKAWQERVSSFHVAFSGSAARRLQQVEHAMRPSARIYDSPRLAAAYAYDRPAVHLSIIQTIGQSLQITTRFRRALDIGCGAGRSTAALEALAETVIGLERLRTMLTHSHAVAP